MLYHHGSNDYDVAASEAAKEARLKFEAQIEGGTARAIAVIDQVQSQIPHDRIVPSSKLEFVHGNSQHPDGVLVNLGDTEEPIHKHALTQMAERADVPTRYVNNLVGSGWGRSLVAHTFNTIFSNMKPGRFLTRSVSGEVRGFLSDQFRRIDSRPIVDAYIKAIAALGAVPRDGFALDTKVSIQAVLPHVFEPVPNEVILIGISLENSDFGDGAFSLRGFADRVWCTNRAITSECLRKVHLGGRLDMNLALSQRTYDLDTETMASATRDIVSSFLGPDSVRGYLENVKRAHEEKVDPKNMAAFLKKALTVDEAKDVTEAYNSTDIENLPAGNTTWRMSNAISWIANTKASSEARRLDLMKVAGQVIEESK